MASSLDTFVQSPLFKFTLNTPDGPKDLIVHSEVIAEISPALKAMMEAPMSEGISNHATLDDVDFECFHWLCQFAYRRRYADPNPKLRPFSDENLLRSISIGISTDEKKEEEAEEALDDIWSWGSTSKKKKNKSSGSKSNDLKVSSKSEFDSLVYTTESLPRWKVPPFELEEYDYLPVFISHAKLYSLAKYYMCESLCSVVLYKIHALLCKFDVSYLSSVDTIVSLVEHVYNDESLDDTEEGVNPLRYLVTFYTASKTKDIGSAPQFVDLVEKGGPFFRAYWDLVCNRVMGSKEWRVI